MADPKHETTRTRRAVRWVLRHVLATAAMIPIFAATHFCWALAADYGWLDVLVPGGDPLRLASFSNGMIMAHLYLWAGRAA